MSFGLCMRMRIRTRIEALRFLVGQRVGSKLPPTGSGSGASSLLQRMGQEQAPSYIKDFFVGASLLATLEALLSAGKTCVFNESQGIEYTGIFGQGKAAVFVVLIA